MQTKISSFLSSSNCSHSSLLDIRYYPVDLYNIYYLHNKDLYILQREKRRQKFLVRTEYKIVKNKQLVLYYKDTIIILDKTNSIKIRPFENVIQNISYEQALNYININNTNNNIINTNNNINNIYCYENKIVINNKIMLCMKTKRISTMQCITPTKIDNRKVLKFRDLNNTQLFLVKDQILSWEDLKQFPCGGFHLFSRYYSYFRSLENLTEKRFLEKAAQFFLDNPKYILKECETINNLLKTTLFTKISTLFTYFLDLCNINNINNNINNINITKIKPTKIYLNNFYSSKGFKLKQTLTKKHLNKQQKIPLTNQKTLESLTLSKVIKNSYTGFDFSSFDSYSLFNNSDDKIQTFSIKKDEILKKYKKEKNFKEIKNILTKKVIKVKLDDEEINEMNSETFKTYLSAGMGTVLFYLNTKRVKNVNNYLIVNNKKKELEENSFFKNNYKDFILELLINLSDIHINNNINTNNNINIGNIISNGIKLNFNYFDNINNTNNINNSNTNKNILLMLGKSIALRNSSDSMLEDQVLRSFSSIEKNSYYIENKMLLMLSMGFLRSKNSVNKLIIECSRYGSFSLKNESTINSYDQEYRFIACVSLCLNSSIRKYVNMADKYSELIVNGIKMFNTGCKISKNNFRSHKSLEGAFYYSLFYNCVDFEENVIHSINKIENLILTLKNKHCGNINNNLNNNNLNNNLCRKIVEGGCLHCYFDTINSSEYLNTKKTINLSDINSKTCNHTDCINTNTNNNIMEEYEIAGLILYCCIKILREKQQKVYYSKILKLALKAEYLSEIIFDTTMLGLVLISKTVDTDIVRILRRQIIKQDRMMSIKEKDNVIIDYRGLTEYRDYNYNYGRLNRYKLLLGVLCAGFGGMKLDFNNKYFILSIVTTFNCVLNNYPSNISNLLDCFILFPFKGKYSIINTNSNTNNKIQLSKTGEEYFFNGYFLKKNYKKNKFNYKSYYNNEVEKKVVMDMLVGMYEKHFHVPEEIVEGVLSYTANNNTTNSNTHSK